MNLNFSWSNISFKFFNLVIEHKFKFLKFLSFLFKLVDSSFFVFNRLLSFFNVVLMSLYLLFIGVCMRQFNLKQISDLIKFSWKLFFLSLCLLELIVGDSEFSFWIQTFLCHLIKLLFVLFLNLIDLVPFFILFIISNLLVFLFQFCDFFS